MLFQTLDLGIECCRRMRVLALLACAFAGIYAGAYWLRFDGEITAPFWRTLTTTLPVVVAVKLAAFAWFRADRGWGRYATFYDLVNLTKAAVAGGLCMTLAAYLMAPLPPMPRSVFLLDWGGTIMLVGALRMLPRLLSERDWLLGLRRDLPRAFIVGANDAGESLLRAIARQPQQCRVVGFIDDDPAQWRQQISGVPVLGATAEVCQLALRHSVTEVLIVAGEVAGKTVRQLVEDCRREGLVVKVLPSYGQLIEGRVAMQARDVCIEDLLQRDPVELDVAHIREWLAGRTVMVTGSAGSIGSELCRQLLRFEFGRLVLVDRSENGQFFLERELTALAAGRTIETVVADVTDAARMRTLFARYRPEIMFHAAAYKHVPLMEENPGEAVKNNVLGTRNLVDLADEFGVSAFVMVSTDKAVNATSVMGATKRAAELYVQAKAAHTGRRFVTVRFGNVLDSAGSVVPIFREQIRRGGPITITDPRMVRFFMTIPEASQLVIQAGALGHGGEIFVLDMGEPVKIVDLARDMVRLSGLRLGEDIEIKVIGSRPGEKLYEELYGAAELHVTTAHPKIRAAKGPPLDHASASEAIARLAKVVDSPAMAVLAALKQVVRDFDRQPTATPLRLVGVDSPDPSDPRREAA